MKRLAALLAVATLALAGCVREVPVRRTYLAVPAASRGLPQERLDALVVAAAESRGFRVTREAPGRLMAIEPEFGVSTRIGVTADRIQIEESTQDGPLESRGTIRRYNNTLRLLESAIMARLVPGQ